MKKKQTLTISKALSNLSRLIENEFHFDEENDEQRKVLIEEFSRPGDLYNKLGKRPIIFIEDSFNVVLQFVREVYNSKELQQADEGQLYRALGEVSLAAQKFSDLNAIFSKAFKGFSKLDCLEAKQTYMKKKISKASEGRALEIHNGLMNYLHILKPAKLAHERISHQSISDTFLSIESLEKDKNYELLYLKKQGGQRFFESHLWKRATLKQKAAGFEKQDFTGLDPLTQLRIWQDRNVSELSAEMLESIHPYLQEFFKGLARFRAHSIVMDVNAMLMALRLASLPHLQLSQAPVKCSYEYFTDFLKYMRKVLNSKDYQNYLRFPPDRGSYFAYVMGFLHSLCIMVYTRSLQNSEHEQVLKNLLETQAEKESWDFTQPLLESLKHSHNQIKTILERYPNGPLFKALDFLQGDFNGSFEPVEQMNLPHSLFQFSLRDKNCSLLRLPSPTFQKYIHECEIIPEFKGFIAGYEQEAFKRRHLFVNLQSRVGWLERARSKEMEALHMEGSYQEGFSCITLAHDSDFYFQKGRYQRIDNASQFKEIFNQKLRQLEGGYYFPNQIRQALFEQGVAQELLGLIHVHFFANEKELTQNERCLFIELAYLFIVLYCVSKLEANSLSFSCKDGLDKSLGQSCGFYIALGLLVEKRALQSEEKKTILHSLLVPSLLVRERVIDEAILERLCRNIAFWEQSCHRFQKANDHARAFDRDFSKWLGFNLEDISCCEEKEN